MNKLQQLLEAAKAAAVLDHNEQEGWYSAEVIREQGAYFPKNARFIAACDPATILELCALLEKAEDALEEANALNQNWSSDADIEMLAYYSEHRAVIKQGNEALTAIKQWKEQT